MINNFSKKQLPPLRIKKIFLQEFDPMGIFISLLSHTCVRRSWLLAGDEGTKYVCRRGLLRYGTVAVGVEKEESSDGALFIVNTT